MVAYVVVYLFLGFIIAKAILSDDDDYYVSSWLFITLLWPVVIIIVLFDIAKETFRW